MNVAFSDTVKREFHFLESHGFVACSFESGLARYESSVLWIEVFREGAYEIALSLGPLLAPDSFSMGSLLRLVDPEVGGRYRNFMATSPELVARGVTELAARLRRCADSGVLADQRLFERLHEGSRQAVTQMATETLMADVRRRLQPAWQAKDYSLVVQLLAPVEHLLTNVERDKLKLARKYA